MQRAGRASAQQGALDQLPRAGVSRLAEDLPHRSLLHDPPRVHDRDAVRQSGDDAQVVRDQQYRKAALAPFAVQQPQDLDLDRHVQRRGRLVGDQHVRVAAERGGDHHALRHPARELERVVARAILRLRYPDLPKQLDHPLPRVALAHPEMQPERLGDLRSHGRSRIEHDLGLLEEHRDAPAPDRVHLAFGLRQHVVGAEPDRTAGDLEAPRQQPHQGQRGQALPATGLADEGEHLPGGDVQRHVVDERAQRSVAHTETLRDQCGLCRSWRIRSWGRNHELLAGRLFE